jgi:hypothetical protein
MCHLLLISRVYSYLLSQCTQSKVRNLQISISIKKKVFRLLKKRKKIEIKYNLIKNNCSKNIINNLYIIIVFHLQVSMVHALFMTMRNSIYKLLKVAPRFIFRELSQLNLQIQNRCNCKHK